MPPFPGIPYAAAPAWAFPAVELSLFLLLLHLAPLRQRAARSKIPLSYNPFRPNRFSLFV